LSCFHNEATTLDVRLYVQSRRLSPWFHEAWLYMILVSVTLAVAAIPEGIPLCATISLPFGCEQLSAVDGTL